MPDDTLVNDRIVNVCGKHQTTPDRTYVYCSLLEPRIDSSNTFESNTFELLYDTLDVLFEGLFSYKTKLLLSTKLGKMIFRDLKGIELLPFGITCQKLVCNFSSRFYYNRNGMV